jgi:hypothetical protein
MQRYFVFSIICFLSFTLSAQQWSSEKISETVEALKKDRRGPYHRIKWFCEDGTIRGPKDPCPKENGGGIQHASYKEEVLELGENNHIFLGDILAYTDKKDFWDAENNQSRFIQYQLQKYLANVDDGWILRRGRYYRGAVQSEDETAWGIDFYKWILSSDQKLHEHFYMIRQSLRDIPHKGDSNLSQKIRSQSKVIAEENPDFMKARIKIHGKPGRSDIQMVKDFKREYRNDLSSDELKSLNQLINNLETYYQSIDYQLWQKRVRKFSDQNDLTRDIQQSLSNYQNSLSGTDKLEVLSNILCTIREGITTIKSSEDRLTLLDLSIAIENELLIQTQEYEPKNTAQLLQKIYHLSHAAMGTGLIEQWEWNSVNQQLERQIGKEKLTLQELKDFLRFSRGIVEWSTANIREKYRNEVETYAAFEEKSLGFIDDKIRSSVALSLGESVSRLSDLIAEESSLKNEVLDLDNIGRIKGLNPGYTLGKLIVVEGPFIPSELNPNHIYAFERPPSDLKPVGGIMTVSEGNLVSHVQLLARNLGIPNAALSEENLKDLKKYEGETVFYAVSNEGNVILKLEKEMTRAEENLFVKEDKNTDRITVPTDQIDLTTRNVVDMRNVDADDSGILCGPKAANLGELKAMFPDNVVEGLVIPFGIFREHMNQKMPARSVSYWEFLTQSFSEAESMKSKGKSTAEIEQYQLNQLKILRNAILQMELKPSFERDLRTSFRNTFSSSLGATPVFLRSDTNMEDLEQFTGAGLNLTLFNIVSEEAILEGIKKVWASPYTERSFMWRQRYLSNPENVYPSILIIPSVDVEYSGVLITKGINVGAEDDMTVAFSRGAGGAVNGQSAETWWISNRDEQLLSPARETAYIRLPKKGGTSSHSATFNEPILNEENIASIRELTAQVRKAMRKKNTKYKGAYDIELGFENNKVWLFQIRPFVENDQAASSEYLASIAPKIDYNKIINLQKEI